MYTEEEGITGVSMYAFVYKMYCDYRFGNANQCRKTERQHGVLFWLHWMPQSDELRENCYFWATLCGNNPCDASNRELGKRGDNRTKNVKDRVSVQRELSVKCHARVQMRWSVVTGFRESLQCRDAAAIQRPEESKRIYLLLPWRAALRVATA